MNSYYTYDELKKFKFISVGKNVLISRKASIYGEEGVSIGNNVRIDDFCILSGKICIGNNIHIAAYSALYGGSEGIYIGNYANISSRVAIYALSDDYSGESLTSPVIPEQFKHVQRKAVHIGKHVIIGTGSTVLPGVILGEGVAVGAMSLVKYDLDSWNIYAGNPILKIKERKKNVLDLEMSFESWYNLCK